MSIKLGAAILGVASLLLASDAKALTFELDQSYNGATPTSGSPWLTAIFSQGVGDSVTLSLQSHLNVGSEFFRSIGFNFNPNLDISKLIITQSSGTPLYDSINVGTNDQDLTGGGNGAKGFDISIEWSTENLGQRFQGNDLVVFTFSGISGLTPQDFNYFNTVSEGGNEVPGTLQIAAKVQGIGTSGLSGEITGSSGSTSVADGGSTLIMLGLATTIFAVLRKSFA
jgi:hypothetical protein